MKKIMCILVLAVLLTAGGVSNVAFALKLTSLTLEGVTDSGAWLNAPGGIWSTNLADPLTQLGVRQNGVFLNTPGNGLDLGEISIELQAGVNTFDLFGTSLRGGFLYYGIDLYFDHIATPPGAVVYNSNDGGIGDFSVTPAGTTIAGSANGGLFPDVAPGTAVYSAPDGSTVEILGFSANFSLANPDLTSWGNIGSDGYADTVAQLTVRYDPVPEPSTVFLLGLGLLGIIGFGSRGRLRKGKKF